MAKEKAMLEIDQNTTLGTVLKVAMDSQQVIQTEAIKEAGEEAIRIDWDMAFAVEVLARSLASICYARPDLCRAIVKVLGDTFSDLNGVTVEITESTPKAQFDASAN